MSSVRQAEVRLNAGRLEAFVLAGGLSTRLGRDKSRVCIEGKSMTSLCCSIPGQLGIKTRIIRRDCVPRCGPLGGVLTAFRRSGAEALLFFACDAPFVSATLVDRLIAASRGGETAVFTETASGAGFPFIVPKTARGPVRAQHRSGEFSIQRLADRLGARRIRPNRREQKTLMNINTRDDLKAAREWLATADARR